MLRQRVFDAMVLLPQKDSLAGLSTNLIRIRAKEAKSGPSAEPKKRRLRQILPSLGFADLDFVSARNMDIVESRGSEAAI